MKSHELFRELLQDCNAKQLAGQMGLSTSIIYKWAQPCAEGGSGAVNPLDRVEQLMEFTEGRVIAQWVCEQAGGFYVKNPHPRGTTPHSVVVATNKIVQEFAEMLSLVATAALDNSIAEQESREIRERWESVKSATEEYVTSCELGNFKDIHARAKQAHIPKADDEKVREGEGGR
jgi:hypothetical protein